MDTFLRDCGITDYLRVAAVVVTTCAVAACSTATKGPARAAAEPTPLPESLRRDIRVVRVEGVARTEVQITEAAKGGAAGMGRGAAIGTSANNPGGGIANLITLPLGVLIGSVAGAIAADPGERVEAEERTLREAVVAAGVSDRVRADIVWQLRERTDIGVKVAGESEISSGPVDAVVEVTVDELQLVGDPREVNPSLAFRMRLTTRLLRASGTVLHTHAQYWWGVRRARSAWLADNAAALQQEIGLACATLAERIVDDLFLVLPASVTAPGGQSSAARLRQESPRDPSLRPTLRWDRSSPRQLPAQAELATPDKVRAVTYELRLWSSEKSFPIYTRVGLTEPSPSVDTQNRP